VRAADYKLVALSFVFNRFVQVPGARVLCVDFVKVEALHLQLQLIASAALHITPHGAISDRSK
jgi:hypothetical protein